MNRYQFSVARDGKFLFRTDVIKDVAEMRDVESVLLVKFQRADGYVITRNEFPATYTSVEVN